MSPPLQICLLEDSPDRVSAMLKRLLDRFHTFSPVVFADASKMIRHLTNALGQTILIALDHDLELIPSSKGRLQDPGSGRDVVEFLVKQPPVCPVVLHTTNGPAGDGMQLALVEKGWTTYRVHPWGDLEWIDKDWFPTVREALLKTARLPVSSKISN